MDITTLKAYSYAILVPIFAYTGLSQELVSILFGFIIFDIFTAIIREIIVGERVTSLKAWIGLSSKLLLISVPFILILIGKAVGVDFSPISSLALSTFVVAEGYSILGNIVQIRSKDKTIDEQDSITLLIKKAQSIIRDILSTLLDKVVSQPDNTNTQG